MEQAVSRINGEYAEVGSAPVHYLHQSYPREEMAALYLAADVMLVTSLRAALRVNGSLQDTTHSRCRIGAEKKGHIQIAARERHALR